MKKYDGVKLLQLQSILVSPFDLASIQQLNKKIEMAQVKTKSTSPSMKQGTMDDPLLLKNARNIIGSLNIKKKTGILRSDAGNKPSLKETPKNMKRFGLKEKMTNEDINELKNSHEPFDGLNESEQAMKQFIQLDVQQDHHQDSTDQSNYPNLMKPSVMDSNIEDSVDMHDNSFVQNSETETGTQWLNVPDQVSFNRNNGAPSNTG